jgi:hypothetical protein
MIYQYEKYWIPMKNIEKKKKKVKFFLRFIETKRYINDVSENEIYANGLWTKWKLLFPSMMYQKMKSKKEVKSKKLLKAAQTNTHCQSI